MTGESCAPLTPLTPPHHTSPGEGGGEVDTEDVGQDDDGILMSIPHADVTFPTLGIHHNYIHTQNLFMTYETTLLYLSYRITYVSIFNLHL